MAPFRIDSARAWARQNRRELPWIALLIACVVIHPWFPGPLWFVPLALTIGYFAAAIARARGDRLWVLGCTAVAAAIPLAVLAIWSYHDPRSSVPRIDDYQYFVESSAIAEAWKAGWYPQLSQKGSLPYIGSMHTGYQRVLASLYYVAGARMWIGFALNVICIAVLPALVYLLTAQLFPISTSARFTTPRLAAALTALHPAYAYWVRWMYRDIVLAAVFIACLILITDFLRTRRPLAGVLFLFALMYLTLLRAYSGLGLAAGVALYALAHVPRRIAFWTALYGLLVLLLVSYSFVGSRYFAQLNHSIVTLVPEEAATFKGSLLYFAKGIPRLALAPYGWVRATVQDPQYGMYPGMWMLYLVLYPAGLIGFVWAARNNHLLTLPLLGTAATTALLVLMAYEGDMTRRRLWLETALIPYAAHGLMQPRRARYFIGWYILLALLVSAQLISLKLRG